jgi:hypothetical protein
MKDDNLNQVLDLVKITNYLQGSKSPTDSYEIDKLNNLLKNYSKAGNSFLAMSLYKQISRVSKLMDTLELVEKRLYEQVDELDNQQLFMVITQITNSINQSLTFIDRICNRPQSSKKITNNILFNISQQVVKDNSNMQLDKNQRQNIREMAENVLKGLQYYSNDI